MLHAQLAILAAAAVLPVSPYTAPPPDTLAANWTCTCITEDNGGGSMEGGGRHCGKPGAWAYVACNGNPSWIRMEHLSTCENVLPSISFVRDRVYTKICKPVPAVMRGRREVWSCAAIESAEECCDAVQLLPLTDWDGDTVLHPDAERSDSSDCMWSQVAINGRAGMVGSRSGLRVGMVGACICHSRARHIAPLCGRGVCTRLFHPSTHNHTRPGDRLESRRPHENSCSTDVGTPPVTYLIIIRLTHPTHPPNPGALRARPVAAALRPAEVRCLPPSRGLTLSVTFTWAAQAHGPAPECDPTRPDPTHA